MENTYLYANKNFEEIKQKLYAEIQSALYKKYGENPDPLVLRRVKEEWNFLKKYHSIETAWEHAPEQQAIVEIAFMHDLTRWLRHNNYPYWNRGTGASSFILYLLDVTFVNPLPAHYHCPICHQVYWKNDEYKDGFDLPPATKCKHDNTPLIADGHNIPWQSLFRYPTHAFHFDVDTIEVAKENTILFLEKSWLGKLNPNIELTIPHPQGRPSIIWYDNLTIDCHIKDNHPDFFKTSISNTCRNIALRAWKEILNFESFDYTPKLPEPYTFADLVYVYGLSCSTGAWDENINVLIERFDYSPSDLIAFRDDVFHYFIAHHITERKAYVMSDQVRRGFLFHNLPKRLHIAKDKWVLKRIKSFESLFPKAHALEWIFFNLKTKIKDEQNRYAKPYSQQYYSVDIPNALHALPIAKEDLQKLPQTAGKIVELFYRILEKYYRNVHMYLEMPKIIISTDMPNEYYGRTSIKAIEHLYYDGALNNFNVLIEDVRIPELQEAFTMIKALIEKVKSGNYRTTLTKDVEEVIEKLGEVNNIAIATQNLDVSIAISNQEQKLLEIANTFDDLRVDIPQLCEYNPAKNCIILYINNIHAHYKNAPIDDEALKLRAGLDIVLAHALSTAILFYFMAETQELRKKYWQNNINQAKPNMFWADVKAFGRWLEYTWCKHNLVTNEIYSWQIKNIKEEALQYSSPYYPYAESANILLDEGEFMKDIYINGEATAYLKHNIERKDVLYWDEVDYQ